MFTNKDTIAVTLLSSKGRKLQGGMQPALGVLETGKWIHFARPLLTG